MHSASRQNPQPTRYRQPIGLLVGHVKLDWCSQRYTVGLVPAYFVWQLALYDWQQKLKGFFRRAITAELCSARNQTTDCSLLQLRCKMNFSSSLGHLGPITDATTHVSMIGGITALRGFVLSCYLVLRCCEMFKLQRVVFLPCKIDKRWCSPCWPSERAPDNLILASSRTHCS